MLVTPTITAGQRLYCSFDFSKYFLLGSITTTSVNFFNGGCPFLPCLPCPCPPALPVDKPVDKFCKKVQG
jgi:hypothetical protein